MINAITVTNHIGESKRFELAFPEKSNFIIQNITGLGPCKADINVTEMATQDGSSFNSARKPTRNIVLYLKFMSNPQVEDVRQESYKYFPLKHPVTLLIETDNRKCETYGYVESNEPDIFSNNETTQISIICPDPNFYSAGLDGTDTTVFSRIEPLFEFPFSNENESLWPFLESKSIVFGSIKNFSAYNIYYSGDAETGITITIHAFGDVENITIYNNQTRETMKIKTKLSPEDEIIISTIKGKKSIRLLSDGVYQNILNRLDRNSDWIHLSQGDNIIAYKADKGEENLQFKVENKRAYEGI